ncbi:uncharacterized protein BKA55DRAFT_736733 [Fusarium redolens]|uniref:Uncharacterized protein n=1 Tax=Fusarium redolens TaxID=48865 RepID=A0A9P9KAI3_FUSRE|nr:uncharacterized protein BKA55DRAFT_736733 [Fusarium redolens]KAH7255357.1 hypothetical protein BKA55DRAFT_736733 [Fusarium redolens]
MDLKILISLASAVAVAATAINKPLANSLVQEQDKIGIASCYWSGTAPYCSGECEPGWTERGRSQCGDGSCCWTGSKALCCEDKSANQDL